MLVFITYIETTGLQRFEESKRRPSQSTASISHRQHDNACAFQVPLGDLKYPIHGRIRLGAWPLTMSSTADHLNQTKRNRMQTRARKRG